VGERELIVDSGELTVGEEGRGLDCDGVARATLVVGDELFPGSRVDADGVGAAWGCFDALGEFELKSNASRGGVDQAVDSCADAPRNTGYRVSGPPCGGKMGEVSGIRFGAGENQRAE